MSKLIAFLTLSVLLAISSNAWALESFVAEYAIYKGPVKAGSLTRSFRLNAEARYEYTSRMETSGVVALFSKKFIMETSVGHFDGARFVPYHYSIDKNGERRDYTLHFDHDNMIVSRSDPGHDWSATMPPALLDKLVYQLQFMIDLNQPQENLRYAVADKDRLKHYDIVVHPAETVQTAAGTYQAVKLERSKLNSQKRTIVWCAAELDWVPVKVEYRDKKGGLTNAVLDSIHFGTITN